MSFPIIMNNYAVLLHWMEMLSKTTWVIAQDLIRVIFEDMDLVWLRTMWEEGGSARADMIKILISLALLKLKSRLWFVDLFWRILWCCFGMYLFPVVSLMTSTFNGYVWCYDDVVLYLWYCYVMFYLLSLNPIVFSKVFSCSFLVMTRKVFSRRSCLGGTWLG